MLANNEHLDSHHDWHLDWLVDWWEGRESSSPIIKESKINWFRFPSTRVTHELRIQKSVLSRNDLLPMAFSEVFDNLEETFFEVKEHQMHMNTDAYNVRFQLEFGLSMDVIRLNQIEWTFFNILGAVGGLAVALTYIFAFLHGIFVFKKGENFLVNNLFKRTADKELPGLLCQSTVLGGCFSLLPSCCTRCCCGCGRSYRLYKKGRNLLA